MRHDMAKVIVERPRLGMRTRGAAKGYHRALRRMADEGLPVREGIKRRHNGGTKFFNEHLGPLRRYLDSQVGRPWNKVFSEICDHIDRDSVVQDHVRDHVAEYVITHVLLIDGVPCYNDGGNDHGQPLAAVPWRRWYVCPRTGLLWRIKPHARAGRRPPPTDDTPRFVRVSDSIQCRLIGGAWHLVRLCPLPLVRSGRFERDAVLGSRVQDISPEAAREQYGALVYAVEKRRLARRELSQYPIPAELWG
jgi:hypothetical protein